MEKLCDRDDGKMYPLVLPDLWYYICGTYGRLVSAWHQNAFAIAFIIAVLDILPVLGTGTVLIPWAVLALHLEGFLPELACLDFTL